MTSRKKRITAAILLILAAVLGAYMVIDSMIAEAVLAVGEAQLENLALTSLNSAIRETVATLEEYGPLVTVLTDESGEVTLVQANTLDINAIASKAALTAQRNFASAERQYIRIPLGNAMGSRLLSGQGPMIGIRVQPMGSVSTGYYTEFESAGINQTRHKIYIVLTAKLRMMIGSRSKAVTVTGQMLISETIIVGVVPDSFVNVESTDDLLDLLP